MEPRLRSPVFRDKNNAQFQVIKASAFDDTTTSIKEAGENDPASLKAPALNLGSPTEDVVINFQTENLTGIDSPSRARTTTAEGHLLSGATLQTQADRLITVPEEPRPVDMIGDEVAMRLISTALFYILRIHTISLILFSTITVVISWEISYLYPLGFLWAVDFFELLQMLRHSRKYRTATQSRLKKAVSCLGPLAKTFSSAGSKALLMLYLDATPEFPLVACLAPIAGYELISSIISICNPKLKQLKKMHTGIFSIKALLTMTGAAAALKMENLLTWEWREALLGYWIVLALMFGLMIVSFLCLVNRCCVFFFADNDQFQVYGVLWVVLIISGKAVLSCHLILTLKDIITENLPYTTLFTPFFIIICYNLGMLLFTLGYYTEIENFFKELAAVESEPEATQTYGLETKENQPKPQKIVVPKFLTKSSSTYYRRATDVEINEVKQKRKLRQERVKPKAKLNSRDAKKNTRQRSADMTNIIKDLKSTQDNLKSTTKNDGLNTIAETDQDKTLPTEMGKNQKSQKRQDKGKDFFSTFTNRTGVLGIVPTVARRLGFPSKSKKGYTEQQDNDEGNKAAVGNQSYDMPNRANMSAIDFKDMDKHPISMRLHKTGRGQLGGKEIQELEDKLKILKSGQKGKENRQERMIQSMYIKPAAESGQLNLSGVLEQGPSNDQSMVEETPQVKSGDTSMSQQCLICFDKAPDAVFMECGHGGICYECAVEIWKAAGECYLCRNKIVQVLQIDLKYKVDGDVLKVLSSTQMINWEDNLGF